MLLIVSNKTRNQYKSTIARYLKCCNDNHVAPNQSFEKDIECLLFYLKERSICHSTLVNERTGIAVYYNMFNSKKDKYPALSSRINAFLYPNSKYNILNSLNLQCIELKHQHQYWHNMKLFAQNKQYDQLILALEERINK